MIITVTFLDKNTRFTEIMKFSDGLPIIERYQITKTFFDLMRIQGFNRVTDIEKIKMIENSGGQDG